MKEPITLHLPAYEAMDAKDRQAKLGFIVRMASGERLYLDYPDVHLKRLSPDETVLAVFCYGVNFVIWGRNLGEIADALHGKYVAWLQEFNAAKWQRPANPQATFIERIEAYAKKDEDAPQLEKTPEPAHSGARH